jgi:hypothetical protein
MSELEFKADCYRLMRIYSNSFVKPSARGLIKYVQANLLYPKTESEIKEVMVEFAEDQDDE